MFITRSIRTSYQSLLVALALLSSQFITGCVSTQELTYFQGQPGQTDALPLTSRYTPKIQSGDVLSVQVSSLNPEATTFFNPYAAVAVADRGGQSVVPGGPPTTPAMNGYLVDADGKIELPLLGKISVAGQTTAQIKDRLRGLLKEYLREPTVNVRNLSFTVSVMGEVARPSMLTVAKEQITLLEAISLAGDATIYGNRKNALIIREENGQRTFARVDLTRRDLFTSPYYYLHPNDVVYIEPGKARAAAADRTMQLVPIALSGLSFLAIIFSRY